MYDNAANTTSNKVNTSSTVMASPSLLRLEGKEIVTPNLFDLQQVHYTKQIFDLQCSQHYCIHDNMIKEKALPMTVRLIFNDLCNRLFSQDRAVTFLS